MNPLPKRKANPSIETAMQTTLTRLREALDEWQAVSNDSPIEPTLPPEWIAETQSLLKKLNHQLNHLSR